MNTLHPIMAAALAGFMPFAMSTKDSDEDTDLDVEQDDEDEVEAHQEICNACSGSGEGQHDGTTCRVCKGLGELWVTE